MGFSGGAGKEPTKKQNGDLRMEGSPFSQMKAKNNNNNNNWPANAGDLRDKGLSPGLGRSPGGGHGNPLRYSCLGNPMDRGLGAIVHRIAKRWT